MKPWRPVHWSAVESEVNNLLANGVVAAGVVVSCVLLAGDQLLWVIKLTVGTVCGPRRPQLAQGRGRWDVLASTSLGEEGVEGVITAANGLVEGIWPSDWVPYSRQYSTRWLFGNRPGRCG